MPRLPKSPVDPEALAYAAEWTQGDARAALNGFPVTLDSRFRTLEYSGITAATPNESELEAVLGTSIGNNDARLMATGKLQEILPQRPITYKGQNVVNLGVLAIAVGLAIFLVIHPDRTHLFPFVVGIPLLFGVLMIIPIGGADMPTVISLLNSYAGLSAAAMGFVLNSKLLIVAARLRRSAARCMTGCWPAWPPASPATSTWT